MGRVRHPAPTAPSPATIAASTAHCLIPRFMLAAPSQKRAPAVSAHAAHDVSGHAAHDDLPRRTQIRARNDARSTPRAELPRREKLGNSANAPSTALAVAA